MRVLITGGSGLLGQYLFRSLSKKNEILTTHLNNEENCKHQNSVKLDLRDSENVENIFKRFNPEITIHTASVSTTISTKQNSSKYIYDVNVNATKNLAGLCNNYNSKLIFTSTDLVYAGYRGSWLKEDAKLIPASLYAETKLIAEKKIKEANNNYLIMRLAFLYGYGLNNSTNHFEQMMKKLNRGEKVKLFTDQFRTPISLLETSKFFNILLDSNIKNEIINFGGKERLSRFQLGEIVCDVYEFDKSLLIPITMDNVPELPKVEDVSMNTEKLKSIVGEQMSVYESVKKLKEKRDE